MRFRTKILPAGKTAAGIEVPAKVVAALGSSKRPPVRATIKGFTYRSTVAVMGGKFMLGVSNEVRKSAGVAAGDTVDIDLELDTEAREVPIPPDFAAALARSVKGQEILRGPVLQQEAAPGDPDRCQGSRDTKAAHLRNSREAQLRRDLVVAVAGSQVSPQPLSHRGQHVDQ